MERAGYCLTQFFRQESAKSKTKCRNIERKTNNNERNLLTMKLLWEQMRYFQYKTISLWTYDEVALLSRNKPSISCDIQNVTEKQKKIFNLFEYQILTYHKWKQNRIGKKF